MRPFWRARARAQDMSQWRDIAAAAFAANYEGGSAPELEFAARDQTVSGAAASEMHLPFGRLLGRETIRYGAVSAASYHVPRPGGCLIVTETGPRGVLVNSGGLVDLDCGLQVDSGAWDALTVNSSATVDAAHVTVVGGTLLNAGADVRPTAQTGAPAAGDPLRGLAEPARPALCAPAVTVNSGQTVTAAPGRHCRPFNINAGGRLILEPGVHVFETVLNVGSNAWIEGDGVTLFLAPGGKLQIHANSRGDLAAPTTGPYRGVLVFQSRSNPEQAIFDAGADIRLAGALYFPANELLINSTGVVAPIAGPVAIVTRRLLVNGGARLLLDRDIAPCEASERLPETVTLACGGEDAGQPQLRLIL